MIYLQDIMDQLDGYVRIIDDRLRDIYVGDANFGDMDDNALSGEKYQGGLAHMLRERYPDEDDPIWQMHICGIWSEIRPDGKPQTVIDLI